MAESTPQQEVRHQIGLLESQLSQKSIQIALTLDNELIKNQLYKQILNKDLLVRRNLEQYNVVLFDTRTNSLVKKEHVLDLGYIQANFKFLRLLHKAETYTPEIQFMGVEIEMDLSTTVLDLRSAKWIVDNIIEYNLDEVNGFKLIDFDTMYNRTYTAGFYPKNALPFIRDYVNASCKIIFNNTCPILCKASETDATSVEVSLLPMSYAAFCSLKKELRLILELYKSLKYTDKIQGCGIHIHGSLTSLGTNKKEIANFIKNFLWFLYKNSIIMNKLSNRKFVSSFNSDMYYLIAEDIALLTSEAEMKSKFIQIKDEMLASYIQGNPSRLPHLNTAINKVPKEKMFEKDHVASSLDTFEFRWWHTTRKFTTLYAYIEFMYSIYDYIKLNINEGDNTLLFSNFYDYLISNEESNENIIELINKKFNT